MKKSVLVLIVLTIAALSCASAGSAENVVTIGIYQEPETLNMHLGLQTVVTAVVKPAVEYLIDVDDQGRYFPVLAKEVPTVENGGVSADGLTITYKLREDVVWQDGAPFTAEDVKFTWEAIMNEKNLVKSRTGYEQIESIATPDPYTVVVKYKEYFAPYLTRFYAVLPKHILGDLPDINNAPYNRMPIVTGPFMFTEWKSGDYILLEKNPKYRDADSVKLDKIYFKIIPSREVGIAQLKAGDIDAVWDLVEAQIPQMEKDPAIELCLGNALVSERLLLNLSSSEPPNNGNPDFPHPILGDLKVRQAIQYAIDKQLIVDKLLYGKAKVNTSDIPDGWAHNPDLAMSAYDPEKAVTLLEEAGWTVGNDGIREKDGVKMRLKITTTTGNKLREQVEQVLVAMLKKVGIELYIENVPSSVLFGSWSNNADRKKGRYDMLMYTTGPGIDPHEHFYGYYHSTMIPTEANHGSGYNYTRHRDQELDRYLDLAAAAPNMEERADAYRKAQARLTQILPQIYLYRRVNVDAFRSRVKGWTPNGYGIVDAVFTWDAAKWYIEE
ncbi:ABC transporter substrate-binding protein [candidate division KSB3 bacterium]|uniref:ABC transporter substrate-binding protein n=1 Tax=candidate division KSB3 bacterium TaxID=2044937 RepID=A0A2G6E2S4_9BACT|nr:MAG: ABC transporter substrate-binding protein [candidate division KSB3 bacterium]PIE28655.1 MAG: ABC transporter substrate-binding protein [candidate division KSB3 bacterium]